MGHAIKKAKGWFALACAVACASAHGEEAWQKAMLERAAILERQSAVWAASKEGQEAVAVPKRGLRPGQKGADVKLLCEALAARGFGACEPSVAEYGQMIESRVRAAQNFYGLQVDGLADAQLYGALSLTGFQKADLAHKAALDLRALADWGKAEGKPAPKRAIVVNAASFELLAIDEAGVEVSSKVIVGRPDRRTPMGMIQAVSLKFNPDWSPPKGILAKDVYPSLDAGGDWIVKHGLVMFDQTGQKVDIEGVDSVTAKAMGYRFRQPSGARAALGQLKFETDSKEDIYLHDTNERHLFAQSMRAKSSGCVRVEKWRDLAAWAWRRPMSEIDSRVSTGRMGWEKIESIPVFIGYRRADVVGSKVVVFPDIYGAQPEAK